MGEKHKSPPWPLPTFYGYDLHQTKFLLLSTRRNSYPIKERWHNPHLTLIHLNPVQHIFTFAAVGSPSSWWPKPAATMTSAHS